MLKKDKPKEVEKIKELINKYSVIGILNMYKLPAKQLQEIRNSLKGTAVIKVSKKTILNKALNGSKASALEEKITGQPALLFTNENPFRLFRILKENRIPAGAKLGDIAPNDIVIPKGPTGIVPGPAISTLQKVGLKTTVDKGKIAVAMDKVVVKAGEKVNEDAVNALNLLKIEPMEIGLDLVSAWENDVIYGKDLLDVDIEDYVNNIKKSVTEMTNLSLNTGYLVESTAILAIQKAFTEAKTLAIEANIIDSNIIDSILIKAINEAKALEKML